MLNEEEEIKLTNYLAVAHSTIIPDFNNAREIVLWLAQKLKEVNHEAAKYSEELEKTNREYALHMERCEGL